MTTRCNATSGSLGCARSADHNGAHWLTGNPDRARESLDDNGIDVRPDRIVTCGGCGEPVPYRDSRAGAHVPSTHRRMPEWRRRALEAAGTGPDRWRAVKDTSGLH